MNKILLYFSIKYMGDWDKIYNALKEQEPVEEKVLEENYKKYKGRYLTIVDETFPDRLKEMEKPPFCIFYYGDIKLLQEETIWPITALRKNKEELIELFKEEKTITIGYSSFLEWDIVTNVKNKKILVKDGGIDNHLIITKEVEDKILLSGLLISEYPGYVIPCQKNWERSNEIKIALSNSMFLISSIKEKQLFTLIAETLREGKDIYCLYDNIDKRNINNTLISKGAIGVNGIKEIK